MQVGFQVRLYLALDPPSKERQVHPSMERVWTQRVRFLQARRMVVQALDEMRRCGGASPELSRVRENAVFRIHHCHGSAKRAVRAVGQSPLVHHHTTLSKDRDRRMYYSGAVAVDERPCLHIDHDIPNQPRRSRDFNIDRDATHNQLVLDE